ncbi:type VII secretion-associated serine protease mycosin [Streptomyces sp. NPDC059460]|uniref:type VII secretion-associated serine protease mycosin n=1 Tax=Streptomyces sp. NPDC059460 TaxID=3346840 RepID=UPI00368B197F
MLTSSSTAVNRRRTVVSAVLGLLLIGATSASAYADSVRSIQWHLDAMKAEGMWSVSTGSNVTVAVIDSGVDASSGDLQGQILKGKDLALDSPGDEHVDYDGHGTGMAGLIAGTGESRGGDGAFGLAPDSKILPIRVRDNVGKVNGATGSVNFNEDLTIAIRYAADRGAKVINISMGDEVGTQQLSDAVKYALNKGSLIFAAAGNSGDQGNAIEYPAGTPGVVGVGAVGKDFKKTDESEYGLQVDLSAPGDQLVYACARKTGLCKGHGTSGATALASASAALIWSKHPDWTNNQVLRVMLNTAGGPTSGAERSDYIGYGIVRPRIALKTPGDPGPADVYPLPDLAAAESPTPSAKPSKATGGSEDNDKPAAVAPADDTSNTGLWIGLGTGAAALIGAAVAVPAVRSRRRKVATPYPYQPPYPHPYQQAQPQHQPAPPAFGPPPTAPRGSNSPYGGHSYGEGTTS